jgi:hypothetical protein
MSHKTYVKKDEEGNVLATVRMHEGHKHLLAHGFEEIEDDPKIAEHVKYYSVK